MEEKLHELTREEQDWVVRQFEGLIRRQMARIDVSFDCAEYDDLLQQGRLLVLKTATEFVVDWEDEVDVCRFMCLVGKRIRWRSIDFLRKPFRWREVPCADEDFYYLEDETVEISKDYEQESLIKQVRQALNDEEWQLLEALMELDRPRTEIAKDFGITRKTLYRKRKKIQQKVEKILKKWNT